MSVPFSWMYENPSLAEWSLLDQRIMYLKKFLNGELIPQTIPRIISEGLRERPLSFEADRYKEFLALGAAAAWRTGLDRLESQCYQALTGRSLRGSEKSINHPAIRMHLSQFDDEPSTLLLSLKNDWESIKTWFRQNRTPR